MKKKKYVIELSEDQMRLVCDCLEDVSRFASGQYELRYTIEQMLRGLPFEEQMKRRDQVEILLKQEFSPTSRTLKGRKLFNEITLLEYFKNR